MDTSNIEVKTRDETPVPEAIRSRRVFKRKFSFPEMYRAFVLLPGAAAIMAGNNKRQLVDRHFIKRLQLAVTEVSGCVACSYQHAKMALRQGMSNEEISSFLSGGGDFIKPEEAKGILFAQHFADSRGCPDRSAYESIVQEYGAQRAGIMLSAVQIMIAGNMYGIPYSAFQSRCQGEPFQDSSLQYELIMLIAGILCLPVAAVHGLLRRLAGLPNARFDRSPSDART
ncbi:MAG: carboxymuconolactone decarboxylase family protein [Halioglobus sp.]|nr:carboxymuconolactone decarboxylase family protein [Halioglobus sp.]